MVIEIVSYNASDGCRGTLEEFNVTRTRGLQAACRRSCTEYSVHHVEGWGGWFGCVTVAAIWDGGCDCVCASVGVVPKPRNPFGKKLVNEGFAGVGSCQIR